MKKYIKRISILLIVITIGVLALIPHMIMGELLNKRMNVNKEDLTSLNAIDITLITEDGLSISAWGVKAVDSKATVILLSGIEKPSITAFKGYSKMLKDSGYSSLLIEMRAHGDSEGERVALGMEEYLDVKAGVDYIKKSDTDTQIIVWGTSMGASTAITAIGMLEDIDGVISCSAYSSWTDVFCDYLDNMGLPQIITIAERPFIDLYIGMKYGFDKLQISPINKIENLNDRPILLAHSTDDSQVPFSSYERFIKKLDGENVKTFVRSGDEHFIYYDEYFEEPELDEEFTTVVLDFLASNF